MVCVYGQTYDIKGWTILPSSDGTRFTNDGTGRSMFVRSDGTVLVERGVGVVSLGRLLSTVFRSLCSQRCFTVLGRTGPAASRPPCGASPRRALSTATP